MTTLQKRSLWPLSLSRSFLSLTSPSVDDEIDGGVEGEEEVREGDDPLYERRNCALLLLLSAYSASAALRARARAPPAIYDLVNIWHNLGRLAEDEEQRDEDQDAGEVILAQLTAAWTLLAHCLRWEKKSHVIAALTKGCANASRPPSSPKEN